MNIITWNMQGANTDNRNKWGITILNWLENYGIDMCCLQECGAVPRSAHLVTRYFNGIPGLEYYTWGTMRTAKHILFCRTDPNGNRCNLAIVSHTPPMSGSLVYPAHSPIWRPALGFGITATDFIYSLHAISPNGADTTGLLNAIGNYSGIHCNWAAFGDYNREPDSIATAFTICPPNYFTFSVVNPHARYDYCVKKEPYSVTGLVQDVDGGLSDHKPVWYNI